MKPTYKMQVNTVAPKASVGKTVQKIVKVSLMVVGVAAIGQAAFRMATANYMLAPLPEAAIVKPVVQPTASVNPHHEPVVAKSPESVVVEPAVAEPVDTNSVEAVPIASVNSDPESEPVVDPILDQQQSCQTRYQSKIAASAGNPRYISYLESQQELCDPVVYQQKVAAATECQLKAQESQAKLASVTAGGSDNFVSEFANDLAKVQLSACEPIPQEP
jgi:hypothetical protein